MPSTSRWVIALLASTAMTAALAQQPPAAEAPASQQTRTEDLEPAVDTSTLEPAVDTSAPVSDSAAGDSRSGTSVDSIDPAVDTSAAPAPSEATAPNAATTPGATAARSAARGSGRAMDRLELDTTQITGNRELPKVLYIVPWKRADLGDLVGKPVNSLLDEVLEPVDRDVFRRENRYYRSLQAGAEARSGEAAAPGSGPEK